MEQTDQVKKGLKRINIVVSTLGVMAGVGKRGACGAEALVKAMDMAKDELVSALRDMGLPLDGRG